MMFARSWQSSECYAREDGNLIRVGNSMVERVLSRDGGTLRTVSLVNKLTGKTWAVTAASEARVTFSAAQRIEIPYWRYRPSTHDAVTPEKDQGFREGWQAAGYSDESWRFVDCFTAVGETPRQDTAPVWPGYAWFRTTFSLPADGAGKPVHLSLGGYDNEDWRYYRTFVNGVPAGTRRLEGRWREPSAFVIEPSQPAYAAVRFGEQNLLAVQCGDMDKRQPYMIPEEMEHYIFKSRLVDQFITVGAPTWELGGLSLQEWHSGGDRDWLWVNFKTVNQAEEVEVTFHYEVRSGDPIVRKKVEVRNRGLTQRLLLDIDVEDWKIDAATTPGALGMPVFIDNEAFTALEHPAGVNRGLSRAIRLSHAPGVLLRPRQGVMSRSSLFGVSGAGEARQAFQAYLRKNGRRKDEWVSVYDPLGLVDGTNTGDAMYHITEQVALDTVEQLREMKDRGITFDYYIIDYGWQDTTRDLTWFKDEDFPEGPAKLVKGLDDLGIKFGLWFGVSYGAWTCADYPPVAEKCIVPRPKGSYDVCIAAEPYRTIFRDAILHHIRENKVRMIKIDMTRWYCNSTEHGHLPGRYSVEAQMDTMFQMARELTRACPDLFIFWYWGYSSPFWLLHGDTIQDKGLLMEAAAVASYPNPSFRSSASLNLDQAARFGNLLPLVTHDSLGIWIGNVRWCNYMGKLDWREAWLLDLARGSLLNQPWGNLGLLDESDLDFLAEWYAFLRENWRLFLRTKPILGDPWKMEAYGYAAGDGRHTVITINNPTFRAARVKLSLDKSVGLESCGTGILVRQRYPDRGVLNPARGERFPFGTPLELSLRPFEVVIFEAAAEDLDSYGWPAWTKPTVVDSVPLAPKVAQSEPDRVSASTQLPSSGFAGYTKRAMTGQAELPAVDAARSVAFIVRLSREGAHWYHGAISDLVKLRAWTGSQELQLSAVPHMRTTNGPGSPWILYRSRMPASKAATPVRFEVAGLLPEDVDWRVEGWLYDEWWEKG